LPPLPKCAYRPVIRKDPVQARMAIPAAYPPGNPITAFVSTLLQRRQAVPA